MMQIEEAVERTEAGKEAIEAQRRLWIAIRMPEVVKNVLGEIETLIKEKADDGESLLYCLSLSVIFSKLNIDFQYRELVRYEVLRELRNAGYQLTASGRDTYEVTISWHKQKEYSI